MPAPTLALIDGHYYAYRFFHAMPPLAGPGGRPTGVTYAFANLLAQLRGDAAITHVAVVLDTSEPSFRDRIYPDYKAHRDPMPDALRAQMPDIETICTATHVPVLRAPGYEADDLLVTLAKQAAAAGLDVRLLTKDKDVDQVLSDRIRTWDPGKGELRGPAELLAEKGISAEVIDPRTLTPLDEKTLVESVCKTGGAVIVDEGYNRFGVTAELAAVIARGAFDYLDAPIERLGAMDVPIPFSPALEDITIPSAQNLVELAKTLCGKN